MFRNIPIVTKNLLIANFVVLLIALLMGGGSPERSSLTEWGALHLAV